MVAVPPLVETFQPAFATLLTSCNWPRFTASVSSVPFATFWILPSLLKVFWLTVIASPARFIVPPAPLIAAMPFSVVFKDRPSWLTTRFCSPSFSLTLIFLSVIEIPLPALNAASAIWFFTYSTLVTDSFLLASTLVTYALLVVTLVRPVNSLPNLTTTLLPVLLTTMLSSPLKSTVSPGATFTALPLPVERFQPLLAVSFTTFSWLPFTASVESVEILPSATPVILPSLSMVTLLLNLMPPSAKLMLPAPSPSPVMD